MALLPHKHDTTLRSGKVVLASRGKLSAVPSTAMRKNDKGIRFPERVQDSNSEQTAQDYDESKH